MKWICVSIGLILAAACTTRPVEPTRASRRIIDSTFQQMVNGMQADMEAICKVYADSVYQAAVDSMMAERRAEMNQLVQ